ncbi:putative ribonuclease H-like domain-containing protein [Tanacetum coccineum]|uniref:Ribonuclease H-like domain-containing protein n=1 Tax=Tanacetum coccineum TaxID=301880 RepID=A0ABQ5IBT0_9ASTR
MVAQGYTQEEGINYDEMDVKSAFLYGTIKKEVYVCQPPGFEDPQFSDKVYKVMQRDDGIFIIQDKYVDNILKKFNFSSVKTASTPIKTNKALLKDEEAKDVDVQLYRSMIRSLIIFRYLKGQPKLGLWYPRDSPFDLEAFSDSDYARASLDRKSTIGDCQFLGKRLISWQCKKQTIVSNSTTEAEYVAAANCCRQYCCAKVSIAELKLVLFVTVGDNTAEWVNSRNNSFFASRSDKNAEFHQIVDFLTTSSIHYALTVSPTIYASYIEQFWATAKSKIVNDVKQIHAIVDGKTVIALAEPFNDIYVTPVHTKKVFTNMKRQNKDFSGRITPLFASMLVPQVVEGEGSGQPFEPQPPSSTAPPYQKVGDEVVYTREDERVVRAATTASSLEAEHESGNIHKTRPTTTLNEPSPQGLDSDSGPKCQDTTLGGGVDAQTRFETTSKKSHDPPLLEGNTSGSGEDSMEHQVDLMGFLPPTPHDSPLPGGHTPGSDEGRPNFNELINLFTQLSNRVLALENSKTSQDCSRLGYPKAEKESQKVGKGTKGKNSRDEAL